MKQELLNIQSTENSNKAKYNAKKRKRENSLDILVEKDRVAARVHHLKFFAVSLV